MKTTFNAYLFIYLILSGHLQSLSAVPIDSSEFMATASSPVVEATSSWAAVSQVVANSSFNTPVQNSTITGTVTGPDRITPLEGIKVMAFPMNGTVANGVLNMITQNDGKYIFESLGAGIYKIGFFESQGEYRSEFYSNSYSIDFATDVVVGTNSIKSDINISLVKRGKITGKITGPDKITPLGGVLVTAYYWYNGGWTFVDGSYSQWDDGSYVLPVFESGSYRLGFFDIYNKEHYDRYYENVINIESAKDILVEASGTVSGIDVSMIERGKITGVVKATDGITPLSNILVTAYRLEVNGGLVMVKSERTKSDGSYSIKGLDANMYKIGFFDTINTLHFDQYYGSTTSLTTASEIIIREGAAVRGINALMIEKANISGKVTMQDGITPIQDIVVRIQSLDTSRFGYSVQTYTGKNGSFSFRGLKAGTYKIEYADYQGLYFGEYYNNVELFENAQNIVLGDSTSISGINSSLMKKGVIKGTVTGPDGVSPLYNILVKAYRLGNDGNWGVSNTTSTLEDGSYSLLDIREGSYQIEFIDTYKGLYFSRYYKNLSSIEPVTKVVIGEISTVNGINVSLLERGKITGKITMLDEITPLEQIEARAYKINEDSLWSIVKQSMTSSDGSYSLGGLDSGTYRVGFFNYYNRAFEIEYYDNVSNLESAKDVVVETGGAVSGISASLKELGQITGTVVKSDGITPLQGILVSAFYSNGYGQWYTASSASTNADGTYNLRGLLAGSYRVIFSDQSQSTKIYATKCYDNATDIELAKDIAVTANAVVSGIDISLRELGRISGLVTDADGVTPLGLIKVTVFRYNSYGDWNTLSETTYTNADGSYNIGGLVPGTYRVIFTDFRKNYADEFYGNVASIQFAQDVIVAETITVAGINVSMAKTSSITCKVTGPDGVTPAEGIAITVYVFSESGFWVETTNALFYPSMNADGRYRFYGLAAGTYRLKFSDYNAVYVSEYYDNAYNFESAKNIVVQAGVTINEINVALDVPKPEIEMLENNISINQSSTVSFKKQKAGATGMVKVFTIKNSGNAILSGLKINKKGAGSSNFIFSKLNVTSLAPGESMTFQVKFKSSSVGSSKASLLIMSNDADENPFLIRLLGNGKKGKAKNAIATPHLANSTTRPVFKSSVEKIMISADFAGELKYQTLTVFKLPQNHTALGTVEVSSNLTEWFSGNDHTTVLSDNKNYFQVRDNTPISREQKRFIRLSEAK